MAAEDVLTKQQSPLASSASWTGANVAAAPNLVRPTRFTTLEEEEARQRAQYQRSWLVSLGQLFAFVVVLAAIGGIAWYLSRPASADTLYESITGRVDADDGVSLTRVEQEVDEFLTRYPQDPRADRIGRYKEQIELDKLERKLQRQMRGSSADASLIPAEQLYLRAIGFVDASPDKALAMLESLVKLYGSDLRADSTKDVKSPVEKHADSSARESDVVQLAHRRIVTLQSDLARQRERQLAALNERLEAANALSKKDSQKAAAMYQAIIDLYQADAWADSVVDKARTRLAELKK